MVQFTSGNPFETPMNALPPDLTTPVEDSAFTRETSLIDSITVSTAPSEPSPSVMEARLKAISELRLTNLGPPRASKPNPKKRPLPLKESEEKEQDAPPSKKLKTVRWPDEDRLVTVIPCPVYTDD